MSWDQLFGLANTSTLAAWAALLLLPRSAVLLAALRYGLIGALGLAYALLIMVYFAGTDGGFNSIPAVRALFASDPVLLAGWLHYLAFDLFVGIWIAGQADALGLSRWLQAPILLATFMFGPLGLAVFLLWKGAWGGMTGIAQAPAVRAVVDTPEGSREGQAQSVTLQLTILMLALIVPTALAALLDPRLTNGANSWLKPLKFEVSLAIHFATLAVLLGFIAPAVRGGRLIRWSMLMASVLAALEVAYILVQAGRARASHFNSSTRVEDVAYALMGAGAATIVILTFVAGLVLWRHPRAGVIPSMRIAAAGGLMFSGLATLLIAGYMSQTGAHAVGAVPGATGSLPIVGWSTTAGDLRVSHFFATHAAQAVPLFALAWERLKSTGGTTPTAIFLAVYATFTMATFAQALLGLPFLPWWF